MITVKLNLKFTAFSDAEATKACLEILKVINRTQIGGCNAIVGDATITENIPVISLYKLNSNGWMEDANGHKISV